MLRARFFQDTYLMDYDLVIRRNNEHDVDYKTGIDMYNKYMVDILNPFYNEDLLRNLDNYEDDWLKFVEETKEEGG